MIYNSFRSYLYEMTARDAIADIKKLKIPKDISKLSRSQAQQKCPEVTLGTVGGLAIKAKLPQNPNTDTTYSAGSNLSLSGTTFNVSNTPSFTNITINGYTITVD